MIQRSPWGCRDYYILHPLSQIPSPTPAMRAINCSRTGVRQSHSVNGWSRKRRPEFFYDSHCFSYLVDNSWNFITNITHLITIVVYFFYGIRDAKYILAGAGIAHLLAIYSGTRNDWSIVGLPYAFGVFCTGWFLGGKDVGDLGSIFSWRRRPFLIQENKW